MYTPIQATKVEIYAFIDSQNLRLSVLTDLFDKRTNKLIYKGWRLDYRRFYQYLKDKYHVTKVFLFIGYVPGNEALYTSLQKSGYLLIFKPTIPIMTGEKKLKGNVDAELVLHTMIEYPNYHKAIIIAGDGDYHCLIEYLEQHKKLERILIPNRHSYSSLLKRFNSYFAYVSDLKNKLELTHK
jgi:uncharacterized LabA/DUF88 family protein